MSSYPDDPWYVPVYDLVWLGELEATHPWRQCYGDGFAVVDRGSPTETRIVGCDGGEPEDQSLGRDWKWVVDELRSLQRALESVNAEAKILRDANVDLEQKFIRLREAVQPMRMTFTGEGGTLPDYVLREVDEAMKQ
jgi:hypothetical protein